MIKVKVPASSANMGAGFDTLGVALSLYSRIETEETESGLIIETKNTGGYVPTDKNNLVYRAMQAVFEKAEYKPKGLFIRQNSDIPMTRGLGSSSGCIIGGMLAANVISGRKLSYRDILNLASEMEGHPDNAAPALYGGMCISLQSGEQVFTRSIKLDPKIKFAVMIPDFFVATKKSRGVLPDYVPRKDASFNIQRASMFAYAMEHGDMEMLRYAVSDKLHQQYRRVYIDGFDGIVKHSYECGSRATYLSGSGPTIVSIVDDNYNRFTELMHRYFKANEHEWVCRVLDIDNVGSVVSTLR
ncbi:MAG: homoserine kinase [bacterium]|nr:homoserine kinase [bacterium]